MNEFVKFLTDYKEFIVGVGCFVISLLCILLKRKPKTIDEFQSILDEVVCSLPAFITLVEEPGHGYEKKIKVENAALSLIEKLLSRSLTNNERSLCLKFIDKSIEAILSTPQKKDVKL